MVREVGVIKLLHHYRKQLTQLTTQPEISSTVVSQPQHAKCSVACMVPNVIEQHTTCAGPLKHRNLL